MWTPIMMSLVVTTDSFKEVSLSLWSIKYQWLLIEVSGIYIHALRRYGSRDCVNAAAIIFAHHCIYIDHFLHCSHWSKSSSTVMSVLIYSYLHWSTVCSPSIPKSVWVSSFVDACEWFTAPYSALPPICTKVFQLPTLESKLKKA